ncbi:hypothetical protein [Georgenia muralis]|uniref:Uncharacterized protein n=1 Tax=Georgenia muralis TaxID=154117 RepID=A0A3N5A4A1_9MICO|nr:hypothetical protein [Georgenia muralis]RPF26621.1 hypothetical protein EDD32_1069 [Georgenia muralis]
MSTMLQKAVTPQMSAAYLDRGLDRVAGYVVPAADVAEVTTTQGLFDLHGLGFAGTPFSPDRPIDVLHVPTAPTAVLVPATGGTDEAGRRATGGTFLERPPFNGTGFAGTGDVVAPLSWLEHTRLTPGARLWRFHPGGAEPELIGSYHGVAFGWQNHLSDDSFHALLPSKYVGPVAKLALGTFAADVRTDDDGAPTVVTIVTVAKDPEKLGFSRTKAGTWAKQLAAAEVPELFEIHASARWHGIPVRIVDQGPDQDGQQMCRVTSLAHDADVAERLGMDKVDVGVYETTVPLSVLTDVVYAQRVPRAWAREGQLAQASSAGPADPAGAPARTASAPRVNVGTPVVTVAPGSPEADHPMSKFAAELQRVAQGLVSVSPTGWTRARVLCRMVGSRGEVMAAVTGAEGKEVPLAGLPGDVARAMSEMRHKAYEPGKGTWFTALVTLERSGKLSLNLDYNNEQKWGRPLEPGQFVEDLRRYPRDDEHTPAWLRERLAADAAAQATDQPGADDAGPTDPAGADDAGPTDPAGGATPRS